MVLRPGPSWHRWRQFPGPGFEGQGHLPPRAPALEGFPGILELSTLLSARVRLLLRASKVNEFHLKHKKSIFAAELLFQHRFGINLVRKWANKYLQR